MELDNADPRPERFEPGFGILKADSDSEDGAKSSPAPLHEVSPICGTMNRVVVSFAFTNQHAGRQLSLPLDMPPSSGTQAAN
jgi:hypothetical protein